MNINGQIYSVPDCCGACGSVLHPWLSGVRDSVYGVDGDWDLRRCAKKTCACGYLDARLTPEQLVEFYSNYSTHSAPVLDVTGANRLFRQAIQWTTHLGLAYPPPDVPAHAKMLGGIFRILALLRHTAFSRVLWDDLLNYAGRQLQT